MTPSSTSSTNSSRWGPRSRLRVLRPARRAELEVLLQPLVSLSGRVLDEDGKPLRRAAVSLFRNVNYPEQSGRSFGVSIATVNEANDDGTYTFKGLIPVLRTTHRSRSPATPTQRVSMCNFARASRSA